MLQSFVTQSIGSVPCYYALNFPLRHLDLAAPTLTSGNIGLLKHAPNVFGCAKLIEEIFVKLDTQKNVFSKA
jgi:succinate-semialdehyde dehydrogenase/glutarate-semialdehyde dehydrogenase